MWLQVSQSTFQTEILETMEASVTEPVSEAKIRAFRTQEN